MGRPSETRHGYESRETGCFGRVLPHLASFLAFCRVHNAILHIRLGQAQIPKCHPLFFLLCHHRISSLFLLTLFSSSLPTCSSSLSLSLFVTNHPSLLLRRECIQTSFESRRCRGDRCSSLSILSKMTHAQLSIVVTERRCASPTAVRRHGNLYT